MNISVDPKAEKVTEAILGAAFEVANQLGHGFLEAVYQKALIYELGQRKLAVEEEVTFRIPYKDILVGTYIADLIVEGAIVVEMKTVEALNPSHTGQVLNYLKASGLRVGLLLNFAKPRLEYKRVLL